MSIKFGPAGLGPVKEAVANLEIYHKLGLKACEIAFTYGVYIKNKEDAVKIGKAAEKFGVEFSIHAPYWINLNSSDKEKVQKSKERILKSCEIGHELGAKKVVFHAGYYGIKGTKVPLINPSFKNGVMPDAKEEAYENIKTAILEMQEKIKENKWNIKIAPETMGKTNVFGSIDEIAKLVNETECSFCIDFAHILARYKDYKFKEILEKFEKADELHVHFSGIEYGDKGEKHHKRTPVEEIKILLNNLPKSKKIIIINESPYCIEDSVLGLSLYKE
jgi:deoxyribonuclease-4